MGSLYPQAEEVREALVEPAAAAAVGEELGRGQRGVRTNSSASPTGFHQPSAVHLDQSKGGMGGPVPPLQVSPPDTGLRGVQRGTEGPWGV